MVKKGIIIAGMCFCLQWAFCTQLPEVFTNWLTQYTNDDTADLAEEIYRNALFRLENPIDLNHVDRETLETFAFLSDYQIENLLAYRHDFRYFATKYELCLVKGFDEISLALFLPFVQVKEPYNSKPLSAASIFSSLHYEVTHRFDHIFQPKKGYQNQQYLGKPWAGYIHCRVNNTHISINSIMEKDAGEPFTIPYNKGFDFYSGHIQLSNIHFLKTFVVGDYKAQFGQGLVIGNGNNFSNWSNFSSCSKRNDRISGKTSAEENHFLRGLATTFSTQHWQFSLLSSIKQVDGANGIHRTKKQWLQKKEATTWCIGANVAAHYTHFKIGCSLLYDQYTHLSFIGVDYRTYWKNFQFSGEFAINHKAKIATIHTVQAQLHSTLSWILQLRYYGKNYGNGYGFATNIDNTYQQGEVGAISGIQWQAFKGAQINACVNWFKVLDHQYRVNKTAIGYKTYLGFTYLITTNQQLFAKWQWSKQERNFSDSNTGFLPTYHYQKNTLLLQYNATLANAIYLKSAIAANSFQFFDPTIYWGYAVFQDIGWKNKYIQLTGRIAFFDVPHYDNKITVHEQDVLYAYSNTAYYGKGIRTYLNIGIFPYKNIAIYLKIANWHYLYQNQIGSGNEIIQGPNKTNLHVLFQYKW